MKVLLAYLCNHEDRGDYYLSLLPYGLTSLAALLEREGHSVTLANFSRMGYRKAAAFAAKEKPDLVGVSLFSFNRVDSLKFIRLFKRTHPRTPLVAGGPHATFLAPLLLERYPEIDHVITGEAEKSLPRLITALARGGRGEARIIAGERLDDLDALPGAASFGGKLVGVNPNEQFKFIVSSRGCPHGCIFCSSPGFWEGRVAFRSAESLFDEIEYAHRRYGIIYFSIRDDNFTLRKDRVLRFCNLLRESRLPVMWNCQARVDTVDGEMLVVMKRAGLEHIQYGVESGSPRILKKYCKAITVADIRKAAELTRMAGIYLSVYLMTGAPGETEEDIQATVSLIKKILPGDGIVSPVAYYPGTALYEEMKRKGTVSDEVWFARKEAGLFARGDAAAARWPRQLMQQLSLVRARSWYRAKDFEGHRALMGEECWVTDILEGDFHLDQDDYDRAVECYARVIARHPGNLWGHLRAGKARFLTGDYQGALEYYSRVIEILPAYYGGWLKSAQCWHALGKKFEARRTLEEAQRLNNDEPRIRNLMRLLR